MVYPNKEGAVSAPEQDDPLKIAGKVAVAAVLATTLTTTPIDPDQVQLPQATPIVQILQTQPDQPTTTTDDDDTDQKSTTWQKILKILKYALIVLLLAGGVAFGAIKGCAAIAGSIALPAATDQSQNK